MQNSIKKRCTKLATDRTPECCGGLTKKMIRILASLTANSCLQWKLTEEQKSYILDHFQCSITPYIYRIKTEPVYSTNEENLPEILKKITKSYSSGKRFLVSRLKKRDIDILEEYMIEYDPYKYIIQSYIDKGAFSSTKKNLDEDTSHL